MTMFKDVNIDNLPLSAFGELNTAENSPVFQYSFEYTVDNTELSTKLETGGGTVTQADAMAVVTTSTTTSSSALLQSKRFARYRSGQGGLAEFTALFETAGVAGTNQLAGLGDEVGSSVAVKNGFLVGYVGTTWGVHRFSNDTVDTVALADCDDPLNGTGASGFTIDVTKLNVFKVQFQYLGGGAIEFWVEDTETGAFIKFHTIKYAGVNIVPSVYNPNFRLGIFANNGATTANLIVKTASLAYFVQGRTSIMQTHQPSFSTDTQEKLAVTTEVAIFTIRNKSIYTGKTNFIEVLLSNIYASIEAGAANNLGSVRLVKNATLGGTPAYSDIHATDSVIEMDTASTTVTGGTTIFSVPLAGKNDKANTNITSLGIILAPSETLTLVGTSANSATINGGGLWKELF